MSTTWTRPPRPRGPRRWPCHWQCAARKLAALLLYITGGSAFALFSIGCVFGVFSGGWLYTGILACTSGFAAWCWPHPAPPPAAARASRRSPAPGNRRRVPVIRPPHPSAITLAAFLVTGGAIAYIAVAAVLAIPFAAFAVLTLIVFWDGPARSGYPQCDLEALLDATRECRCCSPQDIAPCTCEQDSGSIRCTAWVHAPADSRSPYQDFTAWEKELHQ